MPSGTMTATKGPVSEEEVINLALYLRGLKFDPQLLQTTLAAGIESKAPFKCGSTVFRFLRETVRHYPSQVQKLVCDIFRSSPHPWPQLDHHSALKGPYETGHFSISYLPEQVRKLNHRFGEMFADNGLPGYVRLIGALLESAFETFLDRLAPHARSLSNTIDVQIIETRFSHRNEPLGWGGFHFTLDRGFIALSYDLSDEELLDVPIHQLFHVLGDMNGAVFAANSANSARPFAAIVCAMS